MNIGQECFLKTFYLTGRNLPSRGSSMGNLRDHLYWELGGLAGNYDLTTEKSEDNHLAWELKAK